MRKQNFFNHLIRKSLVTSKLKAYRVMMEDERMATKKPWKR